MTMPRMSAASKIISAYFTGTSGDTLRGMCDTIRDKAKNPVVAVLVGKAEEKLTMAVATNGLAQQQNLKAGALVKELAAIAGGKGGGKPDFAMAGLKDETKNRRGTAGCGQYRPQDPGPVRSAFACTVAVPRKGAFSDGRVFILQDRRVARSGKQAL